MTTITLEQDSMCIGFPYLLESDCPSTSLVEWFVVDAPGLDIFNQDPMQLVQLLTPNKSDTYVILPDFLGTYTFGVKCRTPV